MNIRSTLLLGLIVLADARRGYVSKVPNGNKIPGIAAVGHENPSGGGVRNIFGLAFQESNLTWTRDLCLADTDGDGATNGEEMGDPCCVWEVGANASGVNATHPGRVDNFTATELSELKCKITNTTLPPPTTSTVAPTTTQSSAVYYSAGFGIVALALAAARV